MQNAVARARSSIMPVLPKAVLTSHFFCKGDKQKTQGCCRYCWLVLAQNAPWPSRGAAGSLRAPAQLHLVQGLEGDAAGSSFTAGGFGGWRKVSCGRESC